MSKTWFITGCSSGFGREIARQALSRGDTVVATARNAAKLDELKALGAKTLSLDVTSPDAEIQAIIAEAIKQVGHIDILMNNAGVVIEGAVEETSDAEVKAHFAANVFGTLAVTRAVLPYMRDRKSGVVAAMGSMAGWYGGVGFGIYSGSKFALAGIFDGLKQEVKHLGIEVTLVEPGYFRTDLLASGNKVVAAKKIDDLEPVMGPARKALEEYNHKQPGDPIKGAALIIEALTKSGRCEGRELPTRLGMGSDYVKMVQDILKKEAEELEAWKDLSLSTDLDE